MTWRPETDAIQSGDELAREGRWQAAVACWLDARASAPARQAAEERLRWILTESGHVPLVHNRREEHRRTAYRILVAALGFGALATALVVTGTHAEGGTSYPLAALAWIAIAAALAGGIAFALRLGTNPIGSNGPPLTSAEISQARKLARSLDRDVDRQRAGTDMASSAPIVEDALGVGSRNQHDDASTSITKADRS